LIVLEPRVTLALLEPIARSLKGDVARMAKLFMITSAYISGNNTVA
jgi:hypothetical protein